MLLIAQWEDEQIEDSLLLTINICYPKSRSNIRNNKTENPSLLLHLHPNRSKWLVLSKRLSIQGTSKFKKLESNVPRENGAWNKGG
ncbi:hypothetical protein OIU84_029891 [Salix udensis]|uniref:Uncharacterized protein n=1 Tax=Salix udensis TaxID=889485 RepID=A0AAD6KA96_9ROSI|nr:hypothetical protein OIU84_029891 [Salix udensis]